MTKTSTAMALADSIVSNTFQEIESEALALIPKAVLTVGLLEAPNSTPAAGISGPTTDLLRLARRAGTRLRRLRGVREPGGLRRDAAPRARRRAGANRPAVPVCGPAEFRRRLLGRRDQAPSRRHGAGRRLGGQQRVLAHPTVACFVTHCGWNSMMEGARHGVPFLCWPRFGDQFCNRSYACDVWRSGAELRADERGVVAKEEVRDKLERLLGNEGIRTRALLLKSAARASVAGGGSSHQNLLRFVRACLFSPS